MKKNILIIDCHPNPSSFCSSLVKSYQKGALSNQVECSVLTIRDLTFNPVLQYGYQQRMELEPDLQMAWNAIQQADHLVWVHPVWWGGLPAQTKGFIDRLFLPGLAFKYRDNSVWWDKLLKGKTARIICTLDQPYWYYWLINGKPAIHQLKKMVLEFCGIDPVKVTYIAPIRNSSIESRTKFLEKVEKLGRIAA